jgi:heterodisulfide reductase subunit C
MCAQKDGVMKISLETRGKAAEFIEKIESISGENLFACYQCGKCSAGCPNISEMDILPNQIIRLLQLGQLNAAQSKTIWVCASCLMCTARCPRGVDLARVMEALRQVNLRAKVDRVEVNRISPENLRDLPQVALISNLRKNTS